MYGQAGKGSVLPLRCNWKKCPQGPSPMRRIRVKSSSVCGSEVRISAVRPSASVTPCRMPSPEGVSRISSFEPVTKTRYGVCGAGAGPLPSISVNVRLRVRLGVSDTCAVAVPAGAAACAAVSASPSTAARHDAEADANQAGRDAASGSAGEADCPERCCGCFMGTASGAGRGGLPRR